MDPLCEGGYGNTVLHSACTSGCQAVVVLLTAQVEKYNELSRGPVTGRCMQG